MCIRDSEHTDRVINNANESIKLTVDLETGMRGFLLTGDEHFLEPYETAKPRIAVALNTLLELTADNPVQTDRLHRLQALQNEWATYAQALIDLQRSSGDYRSTVKAGRGKRLTDEIRKQFEDVIDMEQQLRTTRNCCSMSITSSNCLLYTSPSPRDRTRSRMPSSA